MKTEILCPEAEAFAQIDAEYWRARDNGLQHFSPEVYSRLASRREDTLCDLRAVRFASSGVVKTIRFISKG